MKYNIEGFSQAELLNLNLDVVDALILRWFVDFLPAMTTIDFEGDRYQWVKYKKVIEDLPCLGINNKEVMARRFDKFIQAGIMKKHIYTVGGVYTYFCLTKKYLVLVGSLLKHRPPSTQKSIPLDGNIDTPLDSKVETNNYSIILNSSINNLPTSLNNSSCARVEEVGTNLVEEEKKKDTFELSEKIGHYFAQFELKQNTIDLVNQLYEKEGEIHIKALALDAKEHAKNADSYIYQQLSEGKDWYVQNQASLMKYWQETEEAKERDQKERYRYQELKNTFDAQTAENRELLKEWFNNKARMLVNKKQSKVPILITTAGKEEFYRTAIANNTNIYLNKIANEPNYLLYSWLVLHDNYDTKYCSDNYFNKNIMPFVLELKEC